MKRGDVLVCRDCPAQGLWPASVTRGEWLVVAGGNPDGTDYSLCPACHAAVVRAALRRAP